MLDERFINPYNFVPLAGKCEKKKRDPGDLTGKITCTLETLTPLFIPKDIEKSVDFFHYDDDKTPVIPGSELRGTIRSVFEAAFNGCLSQVNTEYFHRRSKEIKKPGILRNTKDGWQLQKCRIGGISNKPGLKEGLPVFYDELIRKRTSFTLDSRERSKYPRKGFIHIGEEGPEGVARSIFAPFGERVKVACSEIERLEQVLLLYENNNKENDNHSGYREYIKLFRKIKDQQPSQSELVLPVYYSECDRAISYLAPAAISQEVFFKRLHDILEEQGGYNPCECSTQMCPACHVFGFVSKTDALASRIRFGDAVLKTTSPLYEEAIRLPAAGEPKPGAVEFYTEVSEKSQWKYWTYDYYKVEEQPQKGNHKKKVRKSINSNEIKIRGRKFYWHHNKVDKQFLKPVNPNEEILPMECDIKPLKERHRFVFTVYFECLTEEELTQLCWALDFEGSKFHAHKIGRAKPLGFGSVKIKVEEIMTRTINQNSGQWQLNTYARPLYKDKMSKEMGILLNIMQYPFENSHKVHYPKVYTKKQVTNENDLASHRWFSENIEKNRFNQVLPNIEEELDSQQTKKWLKVKEVK